LKLHAGIAQDFIGIAFDQAQAFFAEDIEGRDPAVNIRQAWRWIDAFLSAHPAPACGAYFFNQG